MASDWKFCKIGDVAKIQGGYAFKSKDFSDTGTPVIKIKNVRKRDIDLTDVARVSQEVAEQASSFLVKSWDVLISMTGSGPNAPASIVGRVARHSGEDDVFLINQRVGRFLIKEKEQLDQRFLYYLFSEDKTQLELLSIATGSANQVNISGKQIESIEVNLPPLSEQKAIAHILGSLDDKIELNRQMNETLEAMAQALFKSWFVDFDPVIDNALAAGNAIPDEMLERAEQRKGIEKKDNSDIQKLFTDAFEFTKEMGWIPKGWSIKKAEETASITIGKTPPRKESKWFSDTQKDNLVWVSIRDMGNSNVFINDSSEYLTKESIKKFNVKVIPKNSVMLSFKLTLGRVLIAQKELTTNEAIAHFCNPQFSMSKEYIYCYLSNFKYDSLGSTSSIATAVNSKIIKGMPFIVPSEQVLSAFETLSKIYFDKISLVNQQIDSLANLRDTLLPKLMSGELRIPDAAALVEEI